jgi:glycosyltransferase involved in cell wall biosynthesis
MSYRIAFITGQLSLGGAEQQLYHLVKGLDRSRFAPIVISLGPIADQFWSSPIRNLGVPLWHFDRSFGRIGRVIKIALLLRKEKVQIVHSWSFHTNPYSTVVGRLAGIPIRLSSLRGTLKYLLSQKFLWWMGCWGFDEFITNSVVAARQVAESGQTRRPIRVVPNGTILPEHISQSDRQRLKSELGFSSTHLLIGTIGRIDSNKNQQMLINAFAILADKWESLRLVIIGEGTLKAQLLTTIKRMRLADKIRLPGAIPLASRYLTALEVCCMSSLSEGMPNLIMEASAAGVPVVSTNCGGCVELIDHGVTGYLVSPDDVDGMSRYVDLLLGDPDKRSQMGKEGRKKMRENYSVKGMVAQMAQVYNEVINAKGLEGMGKCL